MTSTSARPWHSFEPIQYSVASSVIDLPFTKVSATDGGGIEIAEVTFGEIVKAWRSSKVSRFDPKASAFLAASKLLGSGDVPTDRSDAFTADVDGVGIVY